MGAILGFSKPRVAKRTNGGPDALLVGELVVAGAGGTVVRATATTAMGRAVFGIVAVQAAAGASVVVFLDGDVNVRVSDATAPVDGTRLYLGATAGLASVVPSPVAVVEIGWTVSAAGYVWPGTPLLKAFVSRMPTVELT